MSHVNGQIISFFVGLIVLAYVFRGAFNSKIAVEHFKDKLLWRYLRFKHLNLAAGR